jgi:hypothetical protein
VRTTQNGVQFLRAHQSPLGHQRLDHDAPLGRIAMAVRLQTAQHLGQIVCVDAGSHTLLVHANLTNLRFILCSVSIAQRTILVKQALAEGGIVKPADRLAERARCGAQFIDHHLAGRIKA